MNPESPSLPPAGFQATRWTLVLRAQGRTEEARIALSELCEAYYQPVLGFLRREGREADAARELAQEFFARLLDREGGIGTPDPTRGKFRSYLLGAVKHFLSDVRKLERREKRGAGLQPVSLDAPDPGDGTTMEVEDPCGETSDHRFDREWAFTVMERAASGLEREYDQAGKGRMFSILQTWLGGESSSVPQAEAAKQLGLNEGAVKVAVHRMRKRFRELIRAEVSQTVLSGSDVDAELRYLVEVLSRA